MTKNCLETLKKEKLHKAKNEKVKKNLQGIGVEGKPVEDQICKPISDGTVALKLDCTAPRGSRLDINDGTPHDDGESPAAKASGLALEVGLDRGGKKLRLKDWKRNGKNCEVHSSHLKNSRQ